MYPPASSHTRPKRSPAKPGRVDLKIEEFQSIIEDQGAKVKITPSLVCPNKDTVEGTNHALGCPVCYGDEVVDLSSKSFESWAFIQSVKLDKMFNIQGTWDTKDALITVPAGIRLNYWYKIEILDFASTFNQLMVRGTGDEDKLRYIPFVNATDTDHYLIDKSGDFYEHGVDYDFSGQNVRWLTSNRPSKLYSIVYPILPTFRLLESLHDNRYYYDSFKKAEKIPVNMPQQYIMRWDYLAHGSGSGESA